MKNLKKSEITIYAVALMLVAAGYFNYSTFEQKSVETYSEDITQISEETNENIGDAILVSNNEIEEKDTLNNTKSNQNEQELQNTSEEQENEEAKDYNVAKNNDETDYYVGSKLDRDKMYAEMISNYEKIINNANSSEVQKSMATEEITKINNTKNAIMICENLILTKGFENCIIFVNEQSINIVVKIEGGLTTESVAKVQNIVSRELEVDIENIHITEK